MKILFIINDAPYGSEKPYNAFRLAMNLQREHPGEEIRIFLMADAVMCAVPSQITPQGFYNIARMVSSIISKGGQVKLCGTCSETRGIKDIALIDGVEISTMRQLSDWTIECDRVLTF